MELSQPLMVFLAGLGIPVVWLVPLTAVVILVTQKYFPNLKLPPTPVKPTPNDQPQPLPVLPLPTNRPILDILLRLLALKAAGAVPEEDAVYAQLLAKEAGSLSTTSRELK